jgi:hypothetical protein
VVGDRDMTDLFREHSPFKHQLEAIEGNIQAWAAIGSDDEATQAE